MVYFFSRLESSHTHAESSDMSQQIPPNSFLSSDGNVYSNNGMYVLVNNRWVQRHSASNSSSTSSQQSLQPLQPLQPPQPPQPKQPQPAPRASYTPTTSYQHPETPLGPISGNDIAAAMHAQFGLDPSTTQLPQPQSTFGTYLATGTVAVAVPTMDVDPTIRAAAGRHPMIGAFVEALDKLCGRRA